jgi:hypothetical protein
MIIHTNILDIIVNLIDSIFIESIRFFNIKINRNVNIFNKMKWPSQLKDYSLFAKW